jgi:hypothetical protein
MTEKRQFNVCGMISYKQNQEIQKSFQRKVEEIMKNELCLRYLKENIELTLISEKRNILDVEVKIPCKNRVRPRALSCLCNFC